MTFNSEKVNFIYNNGYELLLNEDSLRDKIDISVKYGKENEKKIVPFFLHSGVYNSTFIPSVKVPDKKFVLFIIIII